MTAVSLDAGGGPVRGRGLGREPATPRPGSGAGPRQPREGAARRRPARRASGQRARRRRRHGPASSASASRRSCASRRRARWRASSRRRDRSRSTASASPSTASSTRRSTCEFSVNLIPHTVAQTTLRRLAAAARQPRDRHHRPLRRAHARLGPGALTLHPACSVTPPTISAMSIAPVPELVAELAAGRMVILVDEEDRENEGDLVMAADTSRPRRSTSWPATGAV